MGLFEAIFGNNKKIEDGVKGYFSTLTAYNPTFYSLSGGLYEMDQTRAAIHTVATHCSKLKPHVLGTASNNRTIEKMLQYKPNPWQTTSQFLYRLTTILLVENTAFIVPILDNYGRTVGLYPILSSACRTVTGPNNQLFLRYEFSTGKHVCIEWEKVGVLTRMQYKDDLFGSSNGALRPTMELLSMQNQGIQEGIKQGAAIRFMAKLGQTLRPDDLLKEQQLFKKINLGAENSGGVMVIDAKYSDVKQIDSKPFVVDADQMKIINDNVNHWFGVNEKILSSDWDEQTWAAFYESVVEPIALQISLVLTSMFYSPREIAVGNEIQMSANRLQFATVQNKVSLITQLFDRGMLSRNEGREILQMPPIEDGDEFMIRGEYVSTNERIGESSDAERDQSI